LLKNVSMIKIAFSWDDGAVEDLKLMDLSLNYNIPGIFFIPSTNKERGVMSAENIKTLSDNNFEIGAHTYSHTYLTKISNEKANDELRSGKDYLEQILGKEVPHFCFPGGKYNIGLVETSKKYFKSARTADTGALIQADSFLIKPTFHFYDRGRISLIYNSLKNRSPVLKFSMTNLKMSDYFGLIKVIINRLSDTPDFHNIIVWGHSWEIEEYSLWVKLKDFFQFINIFYPGSIFGYSDMIVNRKIT
jgi:peptidoglycan/xylan/chitin deacetylase (PgdA/CDA1 family)